MAFPLLGIGDRGRRKLGGLAPKGSYLPQHPLLQPAPSSALAPAWSCARARH